MWWLKLKQLKDTKMIIGSREWGGKNVQRDKQWQSKHY
jgi:hypothetical protein